MNDMPDNIDNLFTQLFNSKDELKEILSEIPSCDLFKLAEDLNIQWVKTNNNNINRMKCHMAICNKFYPVMKKKKIRYKYKTKHSPWNKYSLSTLYKTLDKYNIKKPKSTNENVCRMWAVHYLSENSIDPYTLKKKI